VLQGVVSCGLSQSDSFPQHVIQARVCEQGPWLPEGEKSSQCTGLQLGGRASLRVLPQPPHEAEHSGPSSTPQMARAGQDGSGRAREGVAEKVLGHSAPPAAAVGSELQNWY
jgi:hypothetical protein